MKWGYRKTKASHAQKCSVTHFKTQGCSVQVQWADNIPPSGFQSGGEGALLYMVESALSLGVVFLWTHSARHGMRMLHLSARYYDGRQCYLLNGCWHTECNVDDDDFCQRTAAVLRGWEGRDFNSQSFAVFSSCSLLSTSFYSYYWYCKKVYSFAIKCYLHFYRWKKIETKTARGLEVAYISKRIIFALAWVFFKKIHVDIWITDITLSTKCNHTAVLPLFMLLCNSDIWQNKCATVHLE